MGERESQYTSIELVAEHIEVGFHWIYLYFAIKVLDFCGFFAADECSECSVLLVCSCFMFAFDMLVCQAGEK